MSQTVCGCGNQLQPAESLVDAKRSAIANNPGRGRHENESEDHPEDWRNDDEGNGFRPARKKYDANPGFCYGAAGIAADQRMRRTGRQTEIPRDDVPRDGADQSGKDYSSVDRFDVDHTGTDRLGYSDPETECGDKIEKCRPHDGLAR